MTNCRKCNVELNEENWLPSCKKYSNHICAPCNRKLLGQYYAKNKKVYGVKHSQYLKTRWLPALKKEVLEHYSEDSIAQCANPFNQHSEPYTDIRALSIDHVDGGGTKHIKELTREGISLYGWLKKKNFPEGFQVLCMNCQFIKRAIRSEYRLKASGPKSRRGLVFFH